MPKSSVLEVQFSPMQFSDTDEQMAHDVDLLFERGADVMGGTEAGGEKAKPLPDLLRAACRKYDYRFHIGRGDWIAVSEELIAGGVQAGYVPVLESHEGAGRHTDRGIPWLAFDTERLGRITVGAGHYLTNGRKPGDPNYELNRRYARAIGRWGAEHGRGRENIVLYLGDQNTVDRTDDTFHGEDFTSLWDELGRYENTGHGVIDVIATLDRDGRVKAVSCRALDDTELRLFTDHFVTVGRIRVGWLEERERGFDARRIAERAAREGGDPLAEVVGQLAGYASVCWEPRPAGVFDSERAAAATDSALAWLRAQGGVPVLDQSQGDRLLLVAPALTLEQAGEFQAALSQGSTFAVVAEAAGAVVIRGEGGRSL